MEKNLKDYFTGEETFSLDVGVPAALRKLLKVTGDTDEAFSRLALACRKLLKEVGVRRISGALGDVLLCAPPAERNSLENVSLPWVLTSSWAEGCTCTMIKFTGGKSCWDDPPRSGN